VKESGANVVGMFMKAWFVNAQIDRAQICSMTHAETKLLQSLDKQGRANTDLFSSRWGRVGCGVFCICTNTCLATWTWQHNEMGDKQKKFWVRGFFGVWTDICLGPWTWQHNGMGDTYEGGKKKILKKLCIPSKENLMQVEEAFLVPFKLHSLIPLKTNQSLLAMKV
jgi:hypothetical protein